MLDKHFSICFQIVLYSFLANKNIKNDKELTLSVLHLAIHATFHKLYVYEQDKVFICLTIGGIAPNQLIARSEFEFKFIRSECNEGCDWCRYFDIYPMYSVAFVV